MNKLLMVVILSTAFTSSAFAISGNPKKGNQPVTMSCPSPESIQYTGGVYRATVKQPGWEGSWISQENEKAAVKRFSSALYFAQDGLKEGVLANCTYELSSGEEVDLAWAPKGREQDLVNLVVSLEGHQGWQKEKGAIGITGYECTRSAPDCRFTPLKVTSD